MTGSPTQNFLALKLAIALKAGNGERFCAEYDNPELQALSTTELDWVKNQARRDSQLPEHTLSARMRWYQDTVKTQTPVTAEIEKENADYTKGREKLSNVMNSIIGNKTKIQSGSDKNQNYTTKSMLSKEERSEFFNGYHDNDIEMKDMSNRAYVINMPDDPIELPLLSPDNNCDGNDAKLPKDDDTGNKSTTNNRSLRRKQQKKEKKQSMSNDQGWPLKTARGVLEAGDASEFNVGASTSGLQDYENQSPMEPERRKKKRTIKAYQKARDGKNRTNQRITAHEPPPVADKKPSKEELDRIHRERANWVIPDWVEQEEKKEKGEKTKKKNKSEKKAPPKKSFKLIKKVPKPDKPQPKNCKQQSGELSSSSSESIEPVNPEVIIPDVIDIPLEGIPPESHEEKTLMCDDDEWVSIPASKPTKIEKIRKEPVTPPRAIVQPEVVTVKPRLSSRQNIEVNITKEDWPGLPPAISQSVDSHQLKAQKISSSPAKQDRTPSELEDACEPSFDNFDSTVAEPEVAPRTPPPTVSPSTEPLPLTSIESSPPPPQIQEQTRKQSEEIELFENILGDQKGLNFLVTSCDDISKLPDKETSYPPLVANLTFGDAPIDEVPSLPKRLNHDEVQQLIQEYCASNSAKTIELSPQFREIVNFHDRRYQQIIEKRNNGCLQTFLYTP